MRRLAIKYYEHRVEGKADPRLKRTGMIVPTKALQRILIAVVCEVIQKDYQFLSI